MEDAQRKLEKGLVRVNVVLGQEVFLCALARQVNEFDEKLAKRLEPIEAALFGRR